MEKEFLKYMHNIAGGAQNNTDLIPLFEAIDAAARITNTTMFVIDFIQNKLVYMTNSMLFIDKDYREHILRESSNPYWALIHNDDKDYLIATRKAYMELLEGFTPTQKLYHTHVIDYRIYTKQRQLIITQKYIPLRLTSDGDLWLGLFCVMPSASQTCEHIAVYGDGFRYAYDFQRKQFLPNTESLDLTDLEKKIILLSSQGKTSEQIASQLSCSYETIKTHKKRIYRKLHVNSIHEAVIHKTNYNL